MDGASPPLFDAAMVVVAVQRNLNSPYFQPDFYRFDSVKEDYPVGTPIGVVTALDGDSPDVSEVFVIYLVAHCFVFPRYYY